MASIKNRLVDYIVSASCLAATSGKPSGLTVARGKTTPFTASAEPMIAVYVGPSSVDPVGLQRDGTPVKRVVTIYCEIRANGAIPDEVLDPLEVWAEQRMFADETMGGLAAGIVGWRAEQDARQSDKTYAVATVAVDVVFVTVRGDPESQGS